MLWYIGAIQVLLGALLYGLGALLIRMNSNIGNPFGLLILAQGLFQMIGIIYKMRVEKVSIWPSSSIGIFLMFVRAVFGSIAFNSNYFACSIAPLGEVSAIVGLYPVSTMLLAHVFLHEKLNIIGLFAMFFSAIGVTILTGVLPRILNHTHLAYDNYTLIHLGFP